jgi:hypothetical protein
LTMAVTRVTILPMLRYIRDAALQKALPKLRLVSRWRQACEEIFEQMRDSLLGRPEIVRRNAQGLCETEQLKVRNPPQLSFDFGERFTAQVPSPAAAAGGQHRLGQPLLAAQLADLRADDVSRIAHVPIAEHEARKAGPDKGSEFGTIFACQRAGNNQVFAVPNYKSGRNLIKPDKTKTKP